MAILFLPIWILAVVGGIFLEFLQFLFFSSVFVIIPIISLIVTSASLFNWSILKNKSFVSLREDSLLVYMAGHKKEWIENRIPLTNIVSVEKLSKEEIKEIKRNSLMHRLRIFPRPKRVVNGFYHILSKPKSFVKVTLYHRFPIYNFYKHSFDNKSEGLEYVEGLYRSDKTLIADASDRHRGSVSLYHEGIEHRNDGPAIRGYVISEFFIALDKKDRDRFLKDLKEKTKDNEPIRPDYDLNRMLGYLPRMEWWDEVDPVGEK
jgi:hypothetical protein